MNFQKETEHKLWIFFGALCLLLFLLLIWGAVENAFASDSPFIDVTEIYPADSALGIELQPYCHIQINDTEGYLMNINWYYFESGSGFIYDSSNASILNGTYYWQFSEASASGTSYIWQVEVYEASNSSRIDNPYFSFTTEYGNMPPTQSDEYPTNETSGISLQTWCNIKIIDDEGDFTNIKWYERTAGGGTVWTLRQTNSSVTNGTYWWQFIQATSYGTAYYWRVDLSNGSYNVSGIYHFTTITLHAPVQSSPSPTNGSINQAFQSWCHITVEDPIGDTMTIRWYESSTGPWILRQTNATASNGTYWWQYVLATGEVQTYYWRVDAFDGTFNTSRVYHFTTTIHTPPVISNPLPVNYSMDRGVSPWCRITVSQIHGYALNVGFYEYIGASWVLIQTNSSVGNGTYWWHYIDASSPFQEYRWKVVATSYGKSSTTCFVFETISNTERYFKNLEYNDYNASGGIYSTVSTTMCKDKNGRQWVFWVGKDTSQHLCIFGSYTDSNWKKWYNITIMDNWNSTTWITVKDAVVTFNNSLVVLFYAQDGSSHSWVGLLTHYPSDPLITWHIRMVYYGPTNFLWSRMAINNTDVIAITGFSLSVYNDLAYHRFTTNTWQDVWLTNYGHFRYWSAADATGDILIKSNINGTFYLCWKYSTGVRVRDSKNLTAIQTINAVTYLEDFVIFKNNWMALLEITSSKLYWCPQDQFGTFMKVEVGLIPVLMTARCSIDSSNRVTIYWRSGTALKIVGPCMYSAPEATWTATLKTLYSFSDGKPFYPSDGYNSMFPLTNVWTTSRWTFSLYNDNSPYWNAMVFYNSTPLPPTPPISPVSTGIEDVPNWTFIGDLWVLLVILAVGVMSFRMISSASRARKGVK